MKFSTIILSLLICLLSFRIGYASEDLQKSQSINLKSVGNARELGGYINNEGKRVKRGILLRTAALSKISSEDIKHLTEDYHLSVIADLRMTYEVAPKPDPVIEGVRYVNLHVINEDLFKKELEKKLEFEGNAIERLRLIVESGLMAQDMYVSFLSETSGKNAYREFFKELLNLPSGHSLLFHCSQGKDRTGCAAMLILSALGVSEEIIMKDYLLTNTFNADSINAQRKMLLSNGIKESELDKYMIVLDEVNPILMNTVMSWLKENYGSPVGYIINELGITEEEIETLKAKFLEE